MTDSKTLKLTAACAFGLEAIVRRELQTLGYESKIEQPGRVSFDGDITAICHANLWLRTADRILIEIAKFDAADFDALFETTKAIDWSEWIPVDGCFPVSAKSRHSALTSVPAIQRSVKRAVVESLQHSHGRLELPESAATYKIEAAILNDIATLTVDTTGASLHKRGYRKLAGPAPLKETLAAAMIQLSFWKPGRPLIDPFCGSGTLPIEAAMIGLNMAPGINREFSCTSWGDQFRSTMTTLQQQARAEQLETLDEKLIGTDIDAQVLSLARYHAKQAGVDALIHWQQKSFGELLSKKQYGCIITNPPYGERLQNKNEIHDLYRSIPQILQRLPTWSHFILTSFPRFEATIQKTADRRRKLYNGRIECTYYQFHGPAPPKQPSANRSETEETATPATTSAAVFGAPLEKTTEQAELFAARLTKRAKHLRRWPTKFGITCYRLYEKDIPEIPLVVDRYENFLHITEYQRPHTRDLGQHGAWLDAMANTASKTLEIPRKNVFVKQRYTKETQTTFSAAGSHSTEAIVNESELKFKINLSDYVDTGLFLDHRITRSMVRDDASGKRMLNLFAYTGSFSVYAADGGAVATTTVDLSSGYLQWARDNMAQNGFTQPCHQYVAADCMKFLNRLKPSQQFDLVVVNPPTFSNSRKTENVWDIQKDYAALLNQLLKHLATGGIIYFSTNFKRFKFDPALINASRTIEISKQTVPEDFRNRRIHRCWKIW